MVPGRATCYGIFRFFLEASVVGRGAGQTQTRTSAFSEPSRFCPLGSMCARTYKLFRRGWRRSPHWKLFPSFLMSNCKPRKLDPLKLPRAPYARVCYPRLVAPSRLLSSGGEDPGRLPQAELFWPPHASLPEAAGEGGAQEEPEKRCTRDKRAKTFGRLMNSTASPRRSMRGVMLAAPIFGRAAHMLTAKLTS